MNDRYHDWLRHVFDHEVKDRRWYFEEDAQEFAASSAEIVELLGRTFYAAGKDLTSFSDAQVDQGLWYLSGGPYYLSELGAASVPLEKRVEAIGGIYHLYADCFAKRCTEILGHLSEEGPPLNSSCYMFMDWFEMDFRLYPDENHDLHESVFQVLEKILLIEHRACREAAFHGLGHMAKICPAKVGEIIDAFLTKTTLDEDLVAYALTAREGRIQ